MEKLVRGVIRIRWIIILIVIGLTVFFGYQIKNITINSDILSSLPDDDPTAILYNKIGGQYGGNDVGMIILEADDIFKTETLQHIKQITDSLRFDTNVSVVTSITNIIDIKSSDWGIEIGKLVDEYDLPDEQPALDSLKDYVFSKDMYKGAIVSEDATATIVMFTLFAEADMQSAANNIKQKVKAMNLPETIYFGGLPFMLNEISDLIISDMARLIPIVFIIITLILLMGFRSVRGMTLPLITAGIAVVWTLGIMAIFGYEITIISSMIPVILLAIGSAYIIHVLNSINLNTLKDRKQALIKAMAYIIVPVVLASLTTAIGFISFIFGAYLTMIKNFGIFTSIGIIIALLLSIFFLPALISALSIYKKNVKAPQKIKNNVLSNNILLPLTNLLFKHPKRVLTVWAVLLIISIAGVFMLETTVNITEYFKKDNPTRISENIMQDKFGGSLPVFVEFEGDIHDPEVLKMMIRTQNFMKEDPNITSSISVANLIEQMNDAMGEGEVVPDERAKIEQLWFLLEGQDILEQLVSDNLDRGIIQSKFASIETNEIESFTKKMNHFSAENSSENCTINFTGIPPLYVKLNNSLIKSQYSSLAIALAMVLLIVGSIMHSFKKGLYAIIPIFVSIIMLLGFMGFTGISIDIATVLVGSVAMGIGIDYSIHVISGFNTHLNDHGTVEKAIQETIMIKGKAVIINVVSVACGFLVLLFAHLLPLQYFGLLIAISMFGSGLGALTLLPVILILTNRKREKTVQ